MLDMEYSNFSESVIVTQIISKILKLEIYVFYYSDYFVVSYKRSDIRSIDSITDFFGKEYSTSYADSQYNYIRYCFNEEIKQNIANLIQTYQILE